MRIPAGGGSRVVSDVGINYRMENFSQLFNSTIVDIQPKGVVLVRVAGFTR
jgi:hypothetical protein